MSKKKIEHYMLMVQREEGLRAYNQPLKKELLV